MNDYLKSILDIIDVNDGAYDGIMIVNKDGVIEYNKICGRVSENDLPGFRALVTGKKLLEVYPEITEENSTVMKTLRTGKTTVGARQVFTWGGYEISMVTTTYPILSKDGSVEAAADVAKFTRIRRKGSQDYSGCKLYQIDDIITKNEELNKIKQSISRIAQNSSPVLIYGETGTGKELVAESLHSSGNRRLKPFVSQNCAAIPSSLLESIFFGTEKGGFTGAESRKGIFEQADKGTLFLDEINSMDFTIQAKILKVIEEQRVRRIGGKEDIDFDVRIVCATNENPERLVESGKMRSDLYYRIGVVKIIIPPLRERPEDIALLTEHFIRHYNEKMGRQIKGLSLMTKQIFEEWSWPGNVRELKNTVESAFNMENGEFISLESIQDLIKKAGRLKKEGEHTEKAYFEKDFIPNMESSRSAATKTEVKTETDSVAGEIMNLTELLEIYERNIIKKIIEEEPVLNMAAKRLSMSPQKLQYRMKRLGLK